MAVANARASRRSRTPQVVRGFDRGILQARRRRAVFPRPPSAKRRDSERTVGIIKPIVRRPRAPLSPDELRRARAAHGRAQVRVRRRRLPAARTAWRVGSLRRHDDVERVGRYSRTVVLPRGGGSETQPPHTPRVGSRDQACPPPYAPCWPAGFLSVLAGACQFGTAWVGLRLIHHHVSQERWCRGK